MSLSYSIKRNVGVFVERKVKSITSSDSPYSVSLTDDIILVDATGGAVTVTLPTAIVGVAGKTYTIKRTDIIASTNLVTIGTTSSQTIDSASAHYLFPAEYVEVVSDNANWHVIQRTPYAQAGAYYLKGATADRRYSSLDNGRYYTLTTSTTSPAINTLWVTTFHVIKTTKFDTISFSILTSAVGAQARAGIYRDNGNCYPGALVFDSGPISAASTGIKNATITSTVQVFPPGLYWLAWECDTTGLQILCSGSTSAIDGLLGRGNTMTTPPAYGYNVAHTFGALPDPYTAGASPSATDPSATNPIPILSLRAI